MNISWCRKMSLRQEAINGAKWTTLSMIIIVILQLIQTSILARLLDPKAFGLMGMVLVVIGFSKAFADMGVSNAIVHRQNPTKEQLSSLYWLNILAGVIVCLIIIAITPLIVDFYNEPKLKELLYWISFTFLITPIGQQFQVLLQKELKFNILAKIEVVSAVIGTLTAICTAYLGFGVMSLVWGQLINALIKSLNLAIFGWKKWKPLLYFRLNDLKGYIGFGFYQMGDRAINYFSANIDYILIGRFLGAEALGIYTLAYQLVLMPLSKINPILNKVAFPVFAKVQNSNTLIRKGYLEVTKLLSFIVFPMLIGLAVVSPVLVPLFYGKGWEKSIELIQILAVLGMIKTLGNPSGSVYLAKGRADIGFKWNMAVAVVNTTVFLFVIPHGLVPTAWSYVGLTLLNFIISRFIMNYIIGLKWRVYLNALTHATIFSVVMGLVVSVLYMSLNKFVLSDILIFFFLVISGMVIYFLLVVSFHREYFSEILNQILKRRKN